MSRLESYSSDLNDLLCAECGLPFNVNELRVHIFEPSTEKKVVKKYNADGAVTEVVVPAHKHFVVHQRDCYAMNRNKVFNHFTVALNLPSGSSEKLKERVSTNHVVLFRLYEQYYTLIEDKKLQMQFSPCLKVSDEALPAYEFEAQVGHNTSFLISNHRSWSMATLHAFFQRTMEFTITLQSNSKDAGGIIKHSSKLLELWTYADKNIREKLATKHQWHLWLTGHKDSLITGEVQLSFLLWIGLDTDTLKNIYHHFTGLQSVSWAHLIHSNDFTNALDAFNTVYTNFHNDLEKEASRIIMHLRDLTLPDSLQVLSLKRSKNVRKITRFSEVACTSAFTSTTDKYIIRINCQPTPVASTYYVMYWKALSHTKSTPALLQFEGIAPEPGIP